MSGKDRFTTIVKTFVIIYIAAIWIIVIGQFADNLGYLPVFSVLFCIVFIGSIAYIARRKKHTARNTIEEVAQDGVEEDGKINKSDTLLNANHQTVCKNCGFWIDKNTQTCPNCNALINKPKSPARVIIPLIFIAVIVGCYFYFVRQ